MPGELPRLVLEPWEKVLHTTASKFTGKAARVARIWGRRRLLLIRRLLPYLESAEVHLLGSGLPSFWIFRGHGMTLTLGMSGFTASNWSQAVNFDLLLPRKTQTSEPLETVLRYLADLPEADVARAIGCSTGSVKVHASRGLAALRVTMGSHGETT